MGAAKKAVKKKVRLVKVLVQPIFVIDDGESLLEPPVEDAKIISAANWPDYSGKQFPAEVKAWEEQLNAVEEPADEQ